MTGPRAEALRALATPPELLRDDHVAERQEVQDALGNLARLRVMGQIEERDYLMLREELKARERALVPQPQATNPPAAMLELAADVQASTPEHLAELLDLLQVRLLLCPDATLNLVQLRPLSA